MKRIATIRRALWLVHYNAETWRATFAWLFRRNNTVMFTGQRNGVLLWRRPNYVGQSQISMTFGWCV